MFTIMFLENNVMEVACSIFKSYKIDLQKRKVIKTIGFPNWVWNQKVTSIDEYTNVLLWLHESTSFQRPDVYNVFLERPSDKIMIGFCVDKNEARIGAETIAKFISLPLADSTSGKKIIREPDKLDESFKDRLKRSMGKTLVDQSLPEVLEISIPFNYKRYSNKVIILAIAIGISVSPLWFLLSQMPLLPFMIMNLIIGLWLSGVPRSAMVKISRDKFTVINRLFLLIPVTTNISINKLEEIIPPNYNSFRYDSFFIKVFGTEPIIAKSDFNEVKFGAYLPQDEQERIYNTILAKIAE